ncbi:MAG: arabinosyltransferase [Pseudonocardiales bacterium]|nr:arabinosyltransferase [Pseudonocardiales bacterium]
MLTFAALLVGCVGVLAAVALPFAPVLAERSTVSWPIAGQPVASSTAFFTPYRPVRLTAEVPCPVLRAAAAANRPVTVLDTASAGAGLLVRVAGGATQVLLNGRLVSSTATAAPECAVTVAADPGGALVAAGGQRIRLDGEPTPQVQAFRTELAPALAAGLSVTGYTEDPFHVRATGLKSALLAVQLLAAAGALAWLCWAGSGAAGSGAAGSGAVGSGAVRSGAVRSGAVGSGAAQDHVGSSTPGPGRGVRVRAAGLAVDLGMLVTLAGWAVIGPLSDDDGFAAMIARNSRLAGYQGNYYRWWNASETPFALAQHVLAPLTEVSLAPLWLRVPSTLLAAVTWFALSRGVLVAALPELARRTGIRLLAAGCFLACWLPFDLGVRPEAYIAVGVTGVLALLWRGRGLPALGAATLLAALTVSASPSGVLLAAPVLVFAPQVVRIVRAGAGRLEIVARVAALCCVGGVALVLVFADQSWHALAVATRWHTEFGPSLPWYAELARYSSLLGDGPDGTATKRVPVLLTLALLPVVGLLLARRTEGGIAGAAEGGAAGAAGRVSPAAARLAGVAVLGLALFWLTPSKWSHHFGGLAGVFAAFLVVAAVLLVRCARSAPAGDRVPLGVGLGGVGLVAVVAGLAFGAPNQWWQPVIYDVPWAHSPIRPGGLPLNSPLVWAGAVGLGYLLVRRRRGAAPANRSLVAAPAVLATSVVAVSVAVLLGSFIAAPIRQPTGSLALANLRWLARDGGCGLADDVQVLPDVPGGLLAPAGTDPGVLDGFSSGAGYDQGAPPPDPPGAGASRYLWGSLTEGQVSTGTLTSPWFTLPRLAADQQVAVSVAGRTGGGNRLALEFGRARPAGGPTARPVPTSPPAAAASPRTAAARPPIRPPTAEGPPGPQVAATPPETVTPLGTVTPPDPQRAPFGVTPQYRLWRAVGVGAAQVPAGADRVRVRAADGTADPDGWLAVSGPRLRQVLGLNGFLAEHRPVLVAWPIAFLFPCVTDPVAVHHGLAQAPVTVLEAPRSYGDLSAATTDPGIGGNFAPLRTLGGLGEETNQLAGRPGVDWGNVLLTHYPAARDQYRVDTSWVQVSGLHG